jgi:hypothetical protein
MERLNIFFSAPDCCFAIIEEWLLLIFLLSLAIYRVTKKWDVARYSSPSSSLVPLAEPRRNGQWSIRNSCCARAVGRIFIKVYYNNVWRLCARTRMHRIWFLFSSYLRALIASRRNSTIMSSESISVGSPCVHMYCNSLVVRIIALGCLFGANFTHPHGSLTSHAFT